MARTRAFTGAYAQATHFADTALASNEGVDIIFALARYESSEGCATAARSFQQVFNAMRAQDRDRSQGARMERQANGGQRVKFTFARSVYDDLICERVPLRNGEWKVCLIKAKDWGAQLTVIDRATGKVLTDEGPQDLAEDRQVLVNSEYDAVNIKIEDMFGDE